MSATHSTPNSANAASPQSAASPRAHAPAPAKAPAAKGKSLKPVPSKAAGKSAAAAKSAVKKAGTDQTKVAPKSGKAVAKPSAKPAKPAPKGAKAGPKGATAEPKVDKAAAPVDQTAAPKANEAHEAKPKALVTEHAGSEAAANHVNHVSAEPSATGTVPKIAAKNDKPEHKKERAHDDSHKKPVIRRSSLVDFPVPPAPVRPPFVPPKPVAVATEESAPVGVNASHSTAFIQKQRQRLLDLRDDLVDALSGMTRDTIRNAPEGSEASGSGMHQGDAGSDAYDRDFALSVLAKEQDALYEIDQALRRIQKGIYGLCEMSNRKIPQARLEAIPFARLTVECQSQWEKEYGNRRFRPSNEVGFSGGNLIEDEDSETVLLDEDED